LKGDPLQSYSAYLDGRSLSDAEVEALRSWIADDERNAAQFVEFAILHAAITDRLMLGRLLEDLAARRNGSPFAPDMLAEAIREIEVNSPRVALPMPPPLPLPERMPLSHILTPLAAAVAVICMGAWMVWQGSSVAPPVAEAPRQSSAAVISPAPEPPKVVATLATSFDADWSGDTAMRPGDELFEGARLSLASGVVKLDMAGGAAVVIEGPSELVLTGSDALRMTQGKTAVRIEGAAESFVVHTPSLQVIDLGTEFGVETSPSGEGQVMVFDGRVALADAPREGSTDSALGSARGSARLNSHQQLDAGFQVNVGEAGAGDVLDAEPKLVVNPRHFLRPDEVEVRLRALAGSTEDQKLAAHYERQRIAGLLAYQGFDAASAGAELTLGLRESGLMPLAEMQFVDDAAGKGGGIEVMGGPVFMQFDTSVQGPFARAGLLSDSGLIGRSGQEIWLSWKSKRLQPDNDELGSAGVSLMFGDRSDLDEPMFFGRGYGEAETVIVQTAWGHAAPPDGERITINVDFEADTPDVQDRPVDNREHQWVARVEFQDGADRVSLWVDPVLSALNETSPQAILDAADVEFDRIRFAVNRAEEVWRFREFAVAQNPRALIALTQVAEFHQDK